MRRWSGNWQARSRVFLLSAVALAQPLHVLAQDTPISTKGTLAVTATLVTGCGVVGGGSASNLNFGTIDFGQYPAVMTGKVLGVSASGTFQIECSPNVTVEVSINAGAHSSNNGTQRNLAGPGGALIPYQLFIDQARTTPFPHNSSLEPTVSGALSLPIYGEATLGAGIKVAGYYTDTAQVTLSY